MCLKKKSKTRTTENIDASSTMSTVPSSVAARAHDNEAADLLTEMMKELENSEMDTNTLVAVKHEGGN